MVKRKNKQPKEDVKYHCRDCANSYDWHSKAIDGHLILCRCPYKQQGRKRRMAAGNGVQAAEGCIAKVEGNGIVVVRKEEDFKEGNIVRLRRVELGKFYFHIDARLGYDIAIEVGNDEDEERYNKGNYFETAEKAAAAVKVVEAALKKFHEENK